MVSKILYQNFPSPNFALPKYARTRWCAAYWLGQKQQSSPCFWMGDVLNGGHQGLTMRSIEGIDIYINRGKGERGWEGCASTGMDGAWTAAVRIVQFALTGYFNEGINTDINVASIGEMSMPILQPALVTDITCSSALHCS